MTHTTLTVHHLLHSSSTLRTSQHFPCTVLLRRADSEFIEVHEPNHRQFYIQSLKFY